MYHNCPFGTVLRQTILIVVSWFHKCLIKSVSKWKVNCFIVRYPYLKCLTYIDFFMFASATGLGWLIIPKDVFYYGFTFEITFQMKINEFYLVASLLSFIRTLFPNNFQLDKKERLCGQFDVWLRSILLKTFYNAILDRKFKEVLILMPCLKICTLFL